MPNVNASNKIEDGEEREGNTDNEEETGENDEASNAGKLADSKISDNEVCIIIVTILFLFVTTFILVQEKSN